MTGPTPTEGHAWYRWEGDTLILDVLTQPRASHDAISGPHADRLKIRITAPPVEGAANQHLTRFLAKTFRVPAAQVELRSGHNARQKSFAIRAPRNLLKGIECP